MTASDLAAAPSASLATAATAIERPRHKRRRMNPSLLAGLILLGIIAAFAVFYPLLVDWNVTEPDFSQSTFAGPSWEHPLGTDNFGRDTLTRIAAGGRIDLVVAT